MYRIQSFQSEAIEAKPSISQQIGTSVSDPGQHLFSDCSNCSNPPGSAAPRSLVLGAIETTHKYRLMSTT
jgi:hypothetical protein